MRITYFLLASLSAGHPTHYNVYVPTEGPPCLETHCDPLLLVEPCDSITWPDEETQLATTGVYYNMHYAVIVDHSPDASPSDLCGQIYKIRSGTSDAPQRFEYALVSGFSSDSDVAFCDNDTVCLLTKAVAHYPCESGPCAIPDAIQVEALDTDGLLDDVAGSLFLHADFLVHPPSGCGGIVFEDAAAPMVAVEMKETSMTGVALEDDPCGAIYTLTVDGGSDTEGTLMQIVGIETSTEPTGKYMFKIASGDGGTPEEGSCRSLCVLDECAGEDGIILATCSLSVEPTKGEEITSTEEEEETSSSDETEEETSSSDETEEESTASTDDEDTSSTTGGFYPTDSTTAAVLNQARPFKYAWCSKITSCGWVPIDAGSGCGIEASPCVARHHGHVPPVDDDPDQDLLSPRCGTVVRLTDPDTKASLFVQYTHFENTDGDIHISHMGWHHLCPHLCEKNNGDLECSLEQHCSGTAHQGGCECIPCDPSAPTAGFEDGGRCQANDCDDCAGACNYIPPGSQFPSQTSRQVSSTHIAHRPLSTVDAAIPLSLCAAAVAPLLL